MASRRNIRAKETELAFEALSIEGSLLSPEWLSKVAQLSAGCQTEADYRVPKGLNLRDEIGRYWRIAQAHWKDFSAGLVSKAEPSALAGQFVTALLKESFGFESLSPVAPIVLSDRQYPIGHSALRNRVPVVIAPAATGIDTLSPAFGDDGRRRSPFGLAQEYLNAAEDALWGVVSDGLILRIVRDNASLTRPAWIEADLGRIFTEERYADFAALWLLLHETRFGRDGQAVTECALETWRNAGKEEGTRAREHLRNGVEDALVALGQGFLSHPDNKPLRAALQDGSLSTRDYFSQLLRLVYRVIFLLTVEERNLLHPEGTPDAARSLYAEGYSLRRLREKALKRGAHDRFSDLWESTKLVLHGLAGGEARLGLPALAGIFAKGQCAALDSAKLENRALLLAVFKLAWLREDGALARVNWRDMGPEELGSVYESLLELVPQISKEGRQFGFAAGGETRGNARKTTGSYYTPDSLVQVLLDSALEPVIADTMAKNPDKPVEALLSLAIVDPACGSGHFLLAAARRVASHVARIQANGTPSGAQFRHALRQVVGHCIYGVDLNPMAVELCKVSLWMEAVEPGLPLTFLNSHIQHGNALLGTTPELMAKGIPDAAWDPIEGDERKVASALKKRNKQGATGQRSLDTLWSQPSESGVKAVAKAVSELDAASDADANQLAQKEAKWENILGSAEYRQQRFIADAWCAAFVWPKNAGPLAEVAPTNELWRQMRDGQGKPPALTEKTVHELAAQYRFFQWHLQFPQVFAKGGFTVVLGNPPWERVKLQEQEFFSQRSPEIATAPNAAARKQLISALGQTNPDLWAEWMAASRSAEGQSYFARQSGLYPLCGGGNINTYSLFAERNRALRARHGRCGFIVPMGIATEDTTNSFFRTVVSNGELSSLYGFENEEFVFPEVHHSFRFALVTIAEPIGSRLAMLTFFLRNAADLQDKARRLSLSRADFEILNPNTRSCPTFRSRRDAELNLAIYRRVGVLVREDDEAANPWRLEARTRLWHMTEDAAHFRETKQLLAKGYRRAGHVFESGGDRLVALYEGKMFHHFDHRFGTYEGQTEAQENQGKLPELDNEAHANPTCFAQPYYCVPSNEAEMRLTPVTNSEWLLGWRDITGSTVQRTVIMSFVPRVAVGNTAPLLFSKVEAPLVACFYADCCSFVVDYAARQKVGGLHLTFGYIKQLPIIPPDALDGKISWDPYHALRDWLLPRILELIFSAWDMEFLARDCGWSGSPFIWNEGRRFHLRCELDAAFFHLYLPCEANGGWKFLESETPATRQSLLAAFPTPRDAVAYIMDTFPIVRKNDEKAHGEYRTKRVILEIYDAMAEAIRTGKPYQTRLDPPPADPRCCHPPRP